MAVSIWDDSFGISVPIEFQTTKKDITKILKGFELDEHGDGYKIFQVHGWDYEALCEVYETAITYCREHHVPVIIHVTELTQPQGHSTSGSHERYKTKERLAWELEFDCILKMKEWILKKGFATVNEIDEIEKAAVERAKIAKVNAWKHFIDPLINMRDDFLKMADITTCNCAKTDKIDAIKQSLKRIAEPTRKDIMSSARQILRLICNSCSRLKRLTVVNDIVAICTVNRCFQQ